MTSNMRIIDTNVLMAAEGMAEQASNACVENCLNELKQIQSKGICLLDAQGEILHEYSSRLSR